ncbi:MAG: VanW family protein [Clostridia bacterium]|nr:VanW family protein [Clostridia bacterium]
MKSKYLIITILIFIILGVGAYFLFSNSNQNKGSTDYTADRTETSQNASPNTANNIENQPNGNNNLNETNKEEKNDEDKNNTSNNTENTDVDENNANSNYNEESHENTEQKAPPVETEIATFTTKIYSKDSGRQNNVKITCNTLNDTVVENGATFSFCNTVGQATTAKGYQKAEIFDAKRK